MTDQNCLIIIEDFGAESTISEVLKGKRDLAKSHIEKLSLRFNVSPELFFEPQSNSATPEVSTGSRRARNR